MIDLMLPCLVSLSLGLTAPNLLAQGTRPQPVPPVVVTTVGVIDSDAVTTVGVIDADAVTTVGVIDSDATFRPTDVHGIQQEKEPTATASPERVRVDLHVTGDGLQFEVRQLDGIQGHPYLIVFYQSGALLVPITVLDGLDEGELTFAIGLDRFAGMPIAVMAARVRDRSEIIDFGALEPAALLAARAHRYP